MILFGRHKSEIRRETDFFAKGKRLIANEIGGDDECIQAGYFKMGGGSEQFRLQIIEVLGNLYGVSLEYLLHDDAPKPNQNETPMQKRIIEKQESRRKTVFVVLVAVLAVAVIVLSVILLVEQPKKPISMRDISGDEVNVTGKGDFDVNW